MFPLQKREIIFLNLVKSKNHSSRCMDKHGRIPDNFPKMGYLLPKEALQGGGLYVMCPGDAIAYASHEKKKQNEW